MPGGVRLALELDVERLGTGQHFQRRLAGIGLVLGIVERRVPERHDGVADIFVDRALALDDGVGHGREKTVHQVREALGIPPCPASRCTPRFSRAY
jgi:hypothetical protein